MAGPDPMGGGTALGSPPLGPIDASSITDPAQISRALRMGALRTKVSPYQFGVATGPTP